MSYPCEHYLKVATTTIERLSRENVEQKRTLCALTNGITEATGKEGSTAILTHIARLESENAELRKKLEAARAHTTEVENALSLYVNIGEMKSRDGLVTTKNGGDTAYRTLYGRIAEQEPPA